MDGGRVEGQKKERRNGGRTGGMDEGRGDAEEGEDGRRKEREGRRKERKGQKEAEDKISLSMSLLRSLAFLTS